MKKLIIFRHGQTQWNKEKRFQGHLDIPLSEQGKEEALQLKEVLDAIPFDCILTSDLKRASMTTQLVLGHRDIPLYATAMLREAHLGEAQGKTQDEIKDLWGEHILKQWFHATEDMKFPGGESKSEALVRFKNYVDDFISKHAYNCIAVSTHGYIIYRLLCMISEVEPKILTIGNCQAFEIDIDEQGKWHWVATLN